MNIQIKDASPDENKRLQDQLTDYNIKTTQTLPRAELNKIDLVVYTPNQDLIGGINAEWVNWGILFIHLLFIHEAYRGQGYGSFLLKTVEERAKKQGCYLAHLDTFDFQGKDFYIKNGYVIFGILDNCPRGHKRYYLKKNL